MSGTHSTALGVLLVTPESTLRKTLRRQLEHDGHAVLAVSTIGDAVARLRSRHYPLVLCANQQHVDSLAEDYALLVDERGLLARTGSYELWLPGIGIDARAVLLMPVSEPSRVGIVVRTIAERLGLNPPLAASR